MAAHARLNRLQAESKAVTKPRQKVADLNPIVPASATAQDLTGALARTSVPKRMDRLASGKTIPAWLHRRLAKRMSSAALCNAQAKSQRPSLKLSPHTQRPGKRVELEEWNKSEAAEAHQRPSRPLYGHAKSKASGAPLGHHGSESYLKRGGAATQPTAKRKSRDLTRNAKRNKMLPDANQPSPEQEQNPVLGKNRSLLSETEGLAGAPEADSPGQLRRGGHQGHCAEPGKPASSSSCSSPRPTIEDVSLAISTATVSFPWQALQSSKPANGNL